MSEPEPEADADAKAPDSEEPGSNKTIPGLRRIVFGIGLLLLAWACWGLRDFVPSMAAKNVTATVEFTTTTERDDTRIRRAFETAMRGRAIDATLEPLPNSLKLMRDSQLTVRAPSSDEAIAGATAIADAMAAAYGGEGSDALSVDIARYTTPVPDATTVALGRSMRAGATVLGLGGLALIALGIRRLRSGPDPIPAQMLWPAVVIVAIGVGPYVLPVEVTLTLLIMMIPASIAAVVLWKAIETRQAAAWPSTRASITVSELRAERHRGSEEGTQVRNRAHVEYEFTLGDRVIRGSRIGIGEIPDSNPEDTLTRYPVGATVPVYYNPKRPEDALLERDPPVRLAWLYVGAAVTMVLGLGVLALFANLKTIFAALSVYFPEGAFLPGVAFCTLGFLMLLGMLWAYTRQAATAAGWPEAGGRIVSSAVEHYQSQAAGRHGSTVVLYEPVIE